MRRRTGSCVMQRFRQPLKSWPVTSIYLCAAMATASGALSSHSVMSQANIEVDAGQTIGTVSKELFGQNIEYEHGTISGGEQNMNGAHGMHSGGLWAEMLRDRKFEEG